MNEEKFWEIIKGGEIEIIRSGLSCLNEGEILAFHHLLTKMISKACNFPLLAANFTIESYVSDDGFREFRAWLISQGEDRFYRAIKDPESITEWLDKDEIDEIDGEPMLWVAEEVYTDICGNDDFYEKVVIVSDPEIEQDWPDDKNAYRNKWPKLVDKYWNAERINEMH